MFSSVFSPKPFPLFALKIFLMALLFLSACTSPTETPTQAPPEATAAATAAATAEESVAQVTTEPTVAEPTAEIPTEEATQEATSAPAAEATEEWDGVGCKGVEYPDWETSPYVLPFPVGETYHVSLSNCTGSYHSQGEPEEFAIDFDMPVGSLITAARAGVVVFVEESGKGGELNNYVIVSHRDKTFAAYNHLQHDGAMVEVGDEVEQGDPIGLSGSTGLAGYPHNHFLVIQDSWDWPFVSVPITFRNAGPNPHGLAAYTDYTALPYDK